MRCVCFIRSANAISCNTNYCKLYGGVTSFFIIFSVDCNAFCFKIIHFFISHFSHLLLIIFKCEVKNLLSNYIQLFLSSKSKLKLNQRIGGVVFLKNMFYMPIQKDYVGVWIGKTKIQHVLKSCLSRICQIIYVVVIGSSSCKFLQFLW